MKKFTYLSILLFTLTMVSCSDTNVLVPSVTSPDQNWQLSHFFSNQVDRDNGQEVPKSLTYTLDESKKELVLTHKFSFDSRAEFDIPTVLITNNGTKIEINYIQTRTNSNIAAIKQPYISKHYFNYSQKGKGTGKNIDVIVRYTFTNPSISNNDVYPTTLLFN